MTQCQKLVIVCKILQILTEISIIIYFYFGSLARFTLCVPSTVIAGRMMLGDGSKIPARSPLETVRLPLMWGDASSSVNHLLMWLTVHCFEVTFSVETVLGEPEVAYCRYCHLTSLIWRRTSSISISHQIRW